MDPLDSNSEADHGHFNSLPQISSPDTSSCMTVRGRLCIFPFKHGGALHRQCLWGDGANKTEEAWCPVSVDDDCNAKEWSRCSSRCPRAGS